MGITRIKIQNNNRISTKMAGHTKIIPRINEILRSQGATYNQLLRQIYKVLTDLLPITGHSLWTIHIQDYYCQNTQNTLILQP